MPASNDGQATPVAFDAALADLNAAAEAIWAACASIEAGLSVEVMPECASTNTTLIERGRRGATETTLLAACRQTAGRGRQGRSWEAAPGRSLTFSLGMALDLDNVPGGGNALSLAVGVALAQALDEGIRAWADEWADKSAVKNGGQGGSTHLAPTGLKWPNDLWIGERKVGGILIEASTVPGLREGLRWVVIGVGLNVCHSPHDDALPAGAVSLAGALPGAESLSRESSGACLSPGMAWRWIAPALVRGVRTFESAGFALFQPAYAHRDVLAGRTVGLWATPGNGPVQGPPSEVGQALGVSEAGALLVHTDAGPRAWTSGEVSVRLHDHGPF